jgi:transcriptional regulator with XRE-family HTH domain
MQTTDSFGDQLRKAAGRQNLSMTEVARKAGIHLTNLSKVASGKRPCGLSMAVRLADALWLGGPDRMAFLQAASATTQRKVPLLGHGQHAYPQEVMSLAANFLNSLGITPDQIARIETDVRDGLRLILTDGTHHELRISLNRSRA